MAIDGKRLLSKTLSLARFARKEINKIPGFFCYGREVIGTDDIHDIDETKLLIDVSGSGYSGRDLEKKLGREYKIEIEMSDDKNILCFITIGDSEKSIELLLKALRDISKKRVSPKFKNTGFLNFPAIPELVLAPRKAFFARKKMISWGRAAGQISGEFIIPFPPDIPLIVPGEKITHDIVEYVSDLKQTRHMIVGPKDTLLESIEIIKNE